MSDDFEHINLRMPKNLLKEVDLLAEDKLSKRSQVIRLAVKKGLPLIK